MKYPVSTIKRQAFLIFVLLFFISPIGTGRVEAQNLGLSVSPPIIETLIKPGISITKDIKIANLGENVFVTARLEPYLPVPSDNDSFSPEPWITIIDPDVHMNKPFFLPQGAEKILRLHIQPPPETTEKSYYRVLFFHTHSAINVLHTGSLLEQKIGLILLVNVSSTGILTKQIEITHFEIPKILDSFDPLRMNIRVKNTGTTYVRPNGIVAIRGLLGKAQFPILPLAVFPGQSQKIQTDSSENTDNTLFLPGFYIGKYTLSADIRLDESTINMHQNSTFYAVPWKALAGIALVTGIILLRGKRRRKKQ